MIFKNILNTNFSITDVNNKRISIKNSFIINSLNIKNNDITKLSADDLVIIFDLYNNLFFNNLLKDLIKVPLKFSLSNRMRSAAGKTIATKNSKGDLMALEISVALKFILNYSNIDREKKVNGIITKDSLDALLLIFEHELCHLLEFSIFKTSSCKKHRFKNISHNIFKHTDVFHQLPTDSEIMFKNYGLHPGNAVTFMHKGIKYDGMIYSLNKRAAVMVADPKGKYADKNGKRYTKWYIPLESLIKY